MATERKTLTNKRWKSENREHTKRYGSTYQRNRARQRKAMLVQLFGGCCEDCGTTGHPVIFDFDHKDPKEKKFDVTNRMGSRRWEEVYEEAQKCRLLCADCHRLRTWVK